MINQKQFVEPSKNIANASHNVVNNNQPQITIHAPQNMDVKQLSEMVKQKTTEALDEQNRKTMRTLVPARAP
jgi:hypothetical protein